MLYIVKSRKHDVFRHTYAQNIESMPKICRRGIIAADNCIGAVFLEICAARHRHEARRSVVAHIYHRRIDRRGGIYRQRSIHGDRVVCRIRGYGLRITSGYYKMAACAPI